MRLTRLELNGFKSFCNKMEIIFPKNITGIVGPNGSGKSNIADAFRWVLGEQNPRLLRGGKMEDVIFNGTQKRKPMNFCEVSLVFDNEDKVLHPDYLEVMITRRVYRNGESEYEINKTPCRLKDIVEMFSDTGIGKEGYSIIGQGKIDEILSRKTEERRAVFEEAAGISYFKIKKHEAELRLNRTEENLARINDIAKEQENLLEPLEIQSKNAKKYLSLTSKLKNLSCALFLIDYDRLEKNEKIANENLERIQKDIVHFENESSNKKLELSQLENDILDSEKNCSITTEQAILSERKIGELKEKYSIGVSKIDSYNENIQRIEKECCEINEKIDSLKNSQGTQQDALRASQKKVDDLKENLITAELKYNNAQAEYSSLNNKIEHKKQQIIENLNFLSKTEANKARLVTIKEQMETRLIDVEKDKFNLSHSHDLLLEELKKAKEKFDIQNNAYSETKEKIQHLNQSILENNTQFQSFNSLVLNAEKELNQKEANLRAVHNMASTYEGYMPSVKNAMQIVREKHIKGTFGTVAEVITVPKLYETAIDMALGNVLQNIITENEAVAKEIIFSLREKNMGRATFLPLNSLKSYAIPPQQLQHLKKLKFIGIASELVRYDKKFSNIISNLLGRTIIVETFDDGLNLKKSGIDYKIVTLQGDILHSGGSISGGSTKTNTHSFLSRNRIIAELEEKIAELTQNIYSKKESLIKIEENIKALQNALNGVLIKERECEIELTKTSEHIKTLEKDSEENTSLLQSFDETISHLNESIKEIGLELTSIVNFDKNSKLKSEELNKEIDNLTQELNLNDELKNSLHDEFIALQLKFNTSEHEFLQLIKDEKTVQNTIEELNGKLKHFNEQRQNYELNIKNDSGIISNLKNQLAEENQKLNEIHELYGVYEKQKLEQHKKIKMLQEEEANLQEAYIKAMAEQHKMELKLNNMALEKKSLTENLWNSYELTYAGAEEFRANDEFNYSESLKEHKQIKSEIRALGNVNVNAVEEYNDLKIRHEELVVQRNDLINSIQDLNVLIKALVQNMEKQFVTNFELLKEYFSETFSRLFGGGSGEIRLTDPDNALECGIEIMVQPPGKKKQLLSLFSGGERALTAIALIFAMLKLHPSPFCIFDEIEAALDDANITYFADYLKEFANKTQFIVVTHRKGTMERCDSLYGVTMAEKGVSTLLSIDISKEKES